MKKRILSFVLMLAVMVSTAVVPVAAETTLNEAAEMYAEVLQDYASSKTDYRFALAYLDEDNVPEMIVIEKDTFQSSNAEVYSIVDKDLTNMAVTTSWGVLQFASKQNIIRVDDTNRGWSSYSFYAMQEETFSQVAFFSSNEAVVPDSSQYRYVINNTDVSLEYYTSQLNGMINAYDWVTFSPNTGESFEVITSNIADMKENPTKYILGYDPITVYLDNEQLSFDQPPVMINDRVLVPMRAIFEAMGAEVTWYDETQTVVAKQDNIRVTMSIGSTSLIYTDSDTEKTVVLDVAPQLVGDRTMVPVRAVAEAFSAEVTWNDSEQSVNIKSN